MKLLTTVVDCARHVANVNGLNRYLYKETKHSRTEFKLQEIREIGRIEKTERTEKPISNNNVGFFE